MIGGTIVATAALVSIPLTTGTRAAAGTNWRRTAAYAGGAGLNPPNDGDQGCSQAPNLEQTTGCSSYVSIPLTTGTRAAAALGAVLQVIGGLTLSQSP